MVYVLKRLFEKVSDQRRLTWWRGVTVRISLTTAKKMRYHRKFKSIDKKICLSFNIFNNSFDHCHHHNNNKFSLLILNVDFVGFGSVLVLSTVVESNIFFYQQVSFLLFFFFFFLFILVFVVTTFSYFCFFHLTINCKLFQNHNTNMKHDFLFFIIIYSFVCF